MPTYPIARLLVPAAPPELPEGFQVVKSPMARGLPHYVDLAKGLRLKVTLPTGLLQDWIDADPAALVAASDDETAPRSAIPVGKVGDAFRPPLRLAAQAQGDTLATVPFALLVRRTFPDDGSAGRGARIEVVALEWKVYAGTVRGVGEFGSYLKFAWRPANAAVDAFGPPVVNPALWHRLEPVFRIESELGLRKAILDARFLVRRYAIHE